jgi:hypothetical protein
MPCVGFEPTIPASEQAKTVHVLDRSATVTGRVEEKKNYEALVRQRTIRTERPPLVGEVKPKLMTVGIRRADHATPSIR